jgi:hypothetical protein
MNTKQHIDQILSSDSASMDSYHLYLELINHLYNETQNTKAARNQNALLLRASAKERPDIVGLKEFFENLAHYCDACVVDAYNELCALLENNTLSVPLRMITLMALSQYAPLVNLETSADFINRFNALYIMFDTEYNADQGDGEQYWADAYDELERKNDAHVNDQYCWADRSRQLCLLAANAGNVGAIFMFAEGHDPDFRYYGDDLAIAQEYYRQAAAQEHQEAMKRLEKYSTNEIIDVIVNLRLSSSPHSVHSDEGRSRSNSSARGAQEQTRPE